MKTADQIDLTKLVWGFWQKSWLYKYDNNYICLFDWKTSGSGCIRSNSGSFSLFKTFTLKSGVMGIDTGRPLKSINISASEAVETLESFKKLGILSVKVMWEEENGLIR